MSEGEQPIGAVSPKLRRGLFGCRKSDVVEALARRERDLADLRREVDTLWLVFSEHDRALRQVTDASAPSTSPGRFDPEPGRTAAPSVPGGDPPASELARLERRNVLVTELADLENAMKSIGEATQALERSVADEASQPGR